ncbi:MAG: hypothetical protein ACE15E_24995 [Acidobacteriota bacterium]
MRTRPQLVKQMAHQTNRDPEAGWQEGRAKTKEFVKLRLPQFTGSLRNCSSAASCT